MGVPNSLKQTIFHYNRFDQLEKIVRITYSTKMEVIEIKDQK